MKHKQEVRTNELSLFSFFQFLIFSFKITIMKMLVDILDLIKIRIPILTTLRNYFR